MITVFTYIERAKMKLMLMALSFFFFSFSANSEQNWKIIENINETNQNKTYFLVSKQVLSNPPLNSPFENTYSSIMFKCDDKQNLSSFFGFNNKPSIKFSRTEGIFNVIKVKIKYDKIEESIELYNPRTWKSNFFLMKDNIFFVQKLEQTNQFTLELNLINQGKKLFRFDTTGFLLNYNNLKKICSS
jgi:hypothetical protein